MIGLVAGWLIKAKVPSAWSRPAAWLLVIVAAVLVLRIGWGAWISSHDEQVVATDRNAGTAQVLGNVLAADRGAGAAKEARDRAFANEQSNLQEKADAAADNGASPLDALFDELR